MSLISKRLVGIVASTALLSLFAQTGHAQVFSTQYGTWYTHRATWESNITNFQTADYVTLPENVAAPWEESGITATTGSTTWIGGGYLSTDHTRPVTFTFAGNAFGGDFASLGANINLTFNVSDSASYSQRVTGFDDPDYTFLGYISNSSSNISVTVSPSSDSLVVDSFTRANGTNPSNPGSNVAPEPGSFALALTGGAALIGICVRRRRNAG